MSSFIGHPTDSNRRQRLEQALGAADELIAVLKDEFTALTNRDSHALDELSRRKGALAGVLREFGGSEFAIAAANRESSDLSAELKNRLSEAKLLNTRNGRVIDASSRFVQRTVDVLFGRDSADQVYSAAGKRAPSPKNRYSTIA